jgi:glycosyltransferase involved in cell wall biosynthesis
MRIKEGMSVQYDIIQTFDHFPNISIPFYILRKRTKSKFVSDWCDLYHLPGGLREVYGFHHDYIYKKVGFVFRKYNRCVESDLRRKSDAVMVISKKLQEIAIENGVEKQNLFIIRGGVDTEKIKPMPKMEARKRLGLPMNARIVEFMGRFQNDLDIIIRSFALAKKEIPNSILLIVGEPQKWTRRLAANYGVMDSYIEVGRCSDELLPQYLACADVFVLPLDKNLANETRWANKFGEYLASGRPVVISNVGDQAAIVRQHKVGLVADNSIIDFSKKIQLILRNKGLSEKMGQKAAETACKHFSWKIMAEKLEYIYYDILIEQ